ncbi:MAG: c-type cytochrome [Planctomycetia bacterium]|nr:c-type cytochrome [Planctomycetia bacterium]
MPLRIHRVYTFVSLAGLLAGIALLTVRLNAVEPQTAVATPSKEDLLKQDFKSQLPRIAPTEPADALKTFTVAPGFKIEQVAAEPLVNSPVAMEWDENGRLFVCEMRGYSENRDESLSRVSMLEDVDGDGRFDKSTVFADKLLWPTAVFCYDGGLFVGDAPDVFYFKDTDGDGKADVKKHVYTGFGNSNVQGLLNCFRWGLDNKIHLATSSTGGDVRKAGPGIDPKTAKTVNVRGRDIAFNPNTYDFELTSGASQHGMSFDDWGRKFVSSNSNHIQQVMYEDRYVARNPFLSAPDARVSIAADGPQAEVFRKSPVEPWRIIRTQLRVSGAVKGMVEGGGRPAGYFTGAGGVTIYRGDAFPDEWKGIAIVGDVGSNLVHRKRLEPNGLEFIARRIDDKSEFVASTDVWFRPAQYANGPDGALYIMDVYREVIEHPASIPPMIKQHLDLTAGRDRGRLYRVIPEKGFQQRPTPKLGSATTAELVALLEHPNAWHRETAARLLYTRQDKSAIEPLKKLAAESKSPLGRMHALYALDGLRALNESLIAAAFDDRHPQVRKHAVRLAERFINSPKSGLLSRLAALADDRDAEVRYQLAFSLGSIFEFGGYDEGVVSFMFPAVKLAKRDAADKWASLALVSSMRDGAPAFLDATLSDDNAAYADLPQIRPLIERLVAQVALQDDEIAVPMVVERFNGISASRTDTALAVARGLITGLKKPTSQVTKLATAGKLDKLKTIISSMLSRNSAIAVDSEAPLKARISAIDELAVGKFVEMQPTLIKLIDNRQPIEVQLGAVAVLGRYVDAGVAEVVLGAWPKLSPTIKEPALEVLFARPERIAALLDALEAGKFNAGDLPPARVQTLLATGDPARKARAEKLLGAMRPSRRSDVVAAYREALAIAGDVARGRETFKKNCTACHKAEGAGHEIGPNLSTIKTRGAETILTNVLDPSREVNPQFVNYMLITDDGRTVTGLISAESATAVTLKRAEGQSDTVLRVNIDELLGTGLSLMPEGLEQKIDKQGMADLIAYIMQLQ